MAHITMSMLLITLKSGEHYSSPCGSGWSPSPGKTVTEQRAHDYTELLGKG